MSKGENKHITNVSFITEIKDIINRAKQKAYSAINTAMIEAYWLVGRRIVEEEQGGASRAEYGKALLKNLATELMPLYGNTYSVRRVQDYRQFYLYFKDIEIWHSRVPNLTWTHYRELLMVSDETARYWYMQEAAKETWSVRTLHRNISSQYYYRLLQSQAKDMARYSMLKDNDRLFQAKYLTFPPTEEELKQEIEQQKEFFRSQHCSLN